MVKSDISAVELKLFDLINKIKAKTLVSIKDLDEVSEVLGYVQLKIEELRKSRDNWRDKYHKLKGL